MSIAVTNSAISGAGPEFVMPPYPVRRFSVADYFELARIGILGEDDQCELLEGWVVQKMVRNPPHDNVIDILVGILESILPSGWFLRSQSAIQTPDSVPEPDLAVIRGKRGRFSDRHPQGTDAGLVIEVAHSTLVVDRKKAEIYARGGVPAYWIINLKDKCLEIYGAPSSQPDGVIRYALPQIVRRDETVDLILDGIVIGKIDCSQVFPK